MRRLFGALGLRIGAGLLAGGLALTSPALAEKPVFAFPTWPMPPGISVVPAALDCLGVDRIMIGVGPAEMGEGGEKSALGTLSHPEYYYPCAGLQLGIDLVAVYEDDPLPDPKVITYLDDLIGFLGYQGLSAEHLEIAPPEYLMPADQTAFDNLANLLKVIPGDPDDFRKAFTLSDFQGDQVVAVRYFAPKVASFAIETPKAGWRKLVRIKAQGGSDAATARVRAGWILFNELGNPIADDKYAFGPRLLYPTLHGPKATQTPKKRRVNTYADAIQMIVEMEPTVVQSDKDPRPSLYFLTFVGKHSGFATKQPAYSLSPYLLASFDIPDVYPGPAKGRYYVPDACIQCHTTQPKTGTSLSAEDLRDALSGGYGRTLTLNYLDTDQWQDVWNGGEFDFLHGHEVTPLIDARHGDANFDTVFDRFRTLNREILDQNRLKDPNASQTATRLVQNWLANHATETSHVTGAARYLQPLDGTAPWDETDEFDQAMLGLLDKYCARCHMSMFFGIHDRSDVKRISGDAYDRVLPDPLAYSETWQYMPQGRKTEDVDHDMAALVCYLARLRTSKNPTVDGCPRPSN